MNPVRLAKWDKVASTNPRIGFYVWLVIIVIVAAVRVLSSDDDPADRLPAVPALASDANLLAQYMTGKGIAALQEEHPELADAIRTTTAPLPTSVDPKVAGRAVDTLYRQRLLSGLARAPDDLLRDMAAFELDVMRRMASTDAEPCRRFGVPSDPKLLDPSERDRQRQLVHRVILESDAQDVGDGSYRFSVPAAILAATQARTGLSLEQVNDALSGRGKDTDVCNVNIAVREAALTGGSDGIRLLRDMRPSADDK